jgi:hypothetical protein
MDSNDPASQGGLNIELRIMTHEHITPTHLYGTA